MSTCIKYLCALCLFLSAVHGFAKNPINFHLQTTEVVVYYGEIAYLPFVMEYTLCPVTKEWVLPHNVFLKNQSARTQCDQIISSSPVYMDGKSSSQVCNLLMGIPGNSFTKGSIYKPVFKAQGYPFPVGDILVRVLPHPFSLSIIPEQNATAGIPFQGNVRNYINYYDENINAGIRPEITVTPQQQNGLYWDSNTQSIMGTPTSTGSYVFSMVSNNGQASGPVPMRIHVQANPAHKPVFKNHYSIAAGTPGKQYTLNLFDLLEVSPDSRISNQISFYIDKNYTYPDWLVIHPEHPEILEGVIPVHMAGQQADITLIAHSNTGGDSTPLTVSIPVAYDLSKKPAMPQLMGMEKSAGTVFYEDLKPYIQHAEDDYDLKIIIEKIIPEAPWLSVSPTSLTALEGHIPEDAVGKTFNITLRANSNIGGSSDSATYRLKIAVDPDKTPVFQSGKPQLPLLYEEQSWRYDFMEDANIFPNYQDEPWTIRFAEGHLNPAWMRFEKNILISDVVPSDIPYVTTIWVVIGNVPGGEGEPVKLLIRKA